MAKDVCAPYLSMPPPCSSDYQQTFPNSKKNFPLPAGLSATAPPPDSLVHKSTNYRHHFPVDAPELRGRASQGMALKMLCEKSFDNIWTDMYVASKYRAQQCRHEVI